ncbi:hypothetical protein ABIE86_002589 [Bradyrhizobium diazoefficiens]
MMSDPTLGFQVDTSGLDKGSQSLDKITQSAAKTEQQAGKTSEALNKMGSGSSGNSIAKTAQSVDKMAESLVRASREAQKNLDVTKSLESIVSKTGTSYTQAAASLQSAINAHKSSAAAVTTNTEAVKKSADAHAVLSTQAQSAFHSIRSIAEGALSGASPIQMLTQQINHLSYAASGQGGLAGAFGEVAGRITGLGPVMGSVALGVGGAVAAFLAASVALAKVGDEVERSKSRLTAITGSTKEGAEAFNQIKDAAKSAGVEFSTLESFVEKASQGIDKANTGWPVITVGANKARDALREMGTTLGKIMQSTGATAQEEGQVFGALASSIAKGGKLTADTFEKIRDVSPQVARAIASAFGVTDLNAFQKSLEQQPKSLQDLEEAIKRIKPAIDAAFDPNKPKTFEQATRELHSAWSDLLETLAKTGAFNGITQILGNTGRDVKQLADGFPDFGKTLQDRVSKPWSDMVNVVQDKNSIFGSSVEIDIDGAIVKALAELGRLPGDGLQSIASFVNSSIPMINNWAQAIISAASSAAQALSSVGSGGGGTGNYDAMGNSTGVSEGNIGSSGGNDTAAMDYGGGSSEYGYFATGGSFTVGGSGGTDSQTVQFKATPGETVEITPPGGNGSQAGSLAALLPASGGSAGAAASSPDLISAHFSEALKRQTTALSDRINASRDAIVLAVNNSASKIATSASGTSGTSAAPASPSVASTPSTPSTSSASSVGSSAGGGGGGATGSKSEGQFGSPWSLNDSKATEDNQAAAPINIPASAFGQAFGRAAAIKGYSGSFPVIHPNTTNNPLTPLDKPANDAGLKQQTDTLKQTQKETSKTVADQVKAQEQQAKSIGDTANNTAGDIRKLQQDSLSSLGDVSKATDEGVKASEDGAEAAKDGADATKDGTDATKDGNQISQSGFDQMGNSLGQTTQEISSGSNSIVSSVDSAASTIASAVESAISSIAGNNNSAPPSNSGGGDSGGSDNTGSSWSTDTTDASSLADGTAALASGGHITGSGTSTSDSIPAMLSNGEYVHNAAAVQHYGVDFMHAVNNRKVKKFADGGPTSGPVSTMPLAIGIGNPTADLISAHAKEMLANQSVSLKDHMEADRNKIISEIDTKVGSASSSILSAINALGASVRSSNSSGSSSSRSSSSGVNLVKQVDAYGLPRVGGTDMFGRDHSIGDRILAAGGMFGDPIGVPAEIANGYYGQSMYATGGSFTVGGSGGSDSQTVKFKATPGETVEITPPGGRQIDSIPGAGLIPAPSLPPPSHSQEAIGRVVPQSDPFGHPDRNARNVNIFVQQGVQADQFVRSRAQIQRAMS